MKNEFGHNSLSPVNNPTGWRFPWIDSVRNYFPRPAIGALSETNLYQASLLTLNPNQRSSSFEVTFVMVPFGSTSSHLAMLSTTSPY